mmetsp:Transcript_42784/g.76973  ORF Transcript_42784/g.76973 Transcript_42784/m.76973 type:complete len:80 (+) Transcript_42784:228-467(+)
MSLLWTATFGSSKLSCERGIPQESSIWPMKPELITDCIPDPWKLLGNPCEPKDDGAKELCWLGAEMPLASAEEFRPATR